MIESYSFGRMRIQGRDYTSDLKIVKGRVIPDWWRKKGHTVMVEDVADLLTAKPAVLVIGKGRPGLLRLDQDLRKKLDNEGIELVELGTGKASAHFNRLLNEGVQVAGGFHLSC